MAYTTQSKLVLGYNNKVRADLVSSVALASATADASFPESNLAYDDPWRMLKVTSTPSGDPVITFTFSSSQTFDCWGLINHNIRSQGYQTVNLQYESGGWNDVGTAVVITTAITTDVNFLLRFDSQSSTQWRIQLVGGTPKPTFYIGAVFMGTMYEASTNTVDGLLNTRLEAANIIEDAAGGARYLVRGAPKMTHSTEATFERVPATQAKAIVETITRNNLGRIVALVQPDQVSANMPTSVEHQFGYVTAINVAPRAGPSTGTHRADIVLAIESAT